MRRTHDIVFTLSVAVILLCATAGLAQTPLQIPLGTNVVGAVAMNSLTLQSPPVHITGGQDTDIPMTVFFRRKVDYDAADVSASARFSLDVTVRVRASTVAAVAGVTMADYDNLSTLAKLQACSAVGLQIGIPKLRAVLTALYTGNSADGADVRAQVASLDSRPPEATDAIAPVIVLVSSDTEDITASYVVIPTAFTDRAAALCAELPGQKR